MLGTMFGTQYWSNEYVHLVPTMVRIILMMRIISTMKNNNSYILARIKSVLLCQRNLGQGRDADKQGRHNEIRVGFGYEWSSSLSLSTLWGCSAVAPLSARSRRTYTHSEYNCCRCSSIYDGICHRCQTSPSVVDAIVYIASHRNA